MLRLILKYSSLVLEQWTYWKFTYGSAISILFAENGMTGNSASFELQNCHKTFRRFVNDSHDDFSNPFKAFT